MYLDKMKQEKQELLTIQKKLANYLHNNYVIYTFDKERELQLDKEYNHGNGKLTYEEYFHELQRITEYSEISKVGLDYQLIL